MKSEVKEAGSKARQKRKAAAEGKAKAKAKAKGKAQAKAKPDAGFQGVISDQRSSIYCTRCVAELLRVASVPWSFEL